MNICQEQGVQSQVLALSAVLPLPNLRRLLVHNASDNLQEVTLRIASVLQLPPTHFQAYKTKQLGASKLNKTKLESLLFELRACSPHILLDRARQYLPIMDAAVLRNRIQCTVDPNADVRRQAELELTHVSFRPALGDLANNYVNRQRLSQGS